MTANNTALGQISDIELKQLRVFKAVVDCGGFAAAETTLNISRPNISNHIANLETRINLVLCKRGRAGFALTEEGAVVYQQTKKLLESFEDLRNTINNLSQTPSGQLNIALSDTLSLDSRCKLPQIIDQFCLNAPSVELSTFVESMNEIERKVLNDEMDIGFIPYHRHLEGLAYTHLFTDYNYLYCGRTHPLYSVKDEDLTESMINEARAIHAGLKPHQEVYKNLSKMSLAGTSYNYESRIAMVLSGHYICFLPEAVAEPHIALGELRALRKDIKNFPLGIAVICKKEVNKNRAKELFLKAISEVFEGIDLQKPY
ncbi:LysR family transcriptional regulator [Marinomonas sp. SBI22]|uniref:LysR family transcriptional regulator n=1 Tax=unclassified Marinomonas TaxID=196814 RepID=UPI0007AF4BBD|nr:MULTISPECIES: LysR family transcriptional regulator [unclassified Marinomonas]KZM44256.1 LysR family transcriptional regulator [Marinomonas sp. SBI22]KZM45414.1 LysR family transcriptional regulator [Marinomonas sp. SBI8L]